MTATKGKTHYELLGVDPQASIAEIRAAYRKKTMQYHPDKNPNLTEADQAEWKLITEVAPIIMKPTSRAEYDDQLEAERIRTEAANDTFDASGAQPEAGEVPDDEFEQMVAESTASTATPPPAKQARHTRQARPPRTNNGPIPGYDPSEIDPLTLIDTTRLGWMKHELDGVKERFVTRHPGALQETLFGTALAAVALLVVGLVILSPTASLLATVLPVVGVIAASVFWFRWAAYISDKIPFMTASVATIGTLGYAGFFAEDTMHPVRALACAALAGLGIYLGTRTHYWKSFRIYTKDNRGIVNFAKKDLKNGRVWGSVGKLVDGNYDDFAKEMGVLGEEHTAEVLRYLLGIPGTRIFHCLRFPTGDGEISKADVDHAVVNGNKVAFIDSKMWKGEKFSWETEDHTWIRRTGHDGRVKRRETHFPKAVDTFSSTTFVSADVRGWIVFHSHDGGKVMVDNTASGRTRLVTPHRLIEEIGTWFVEDDKNPGQVNPKLGTVDKTLMRTALSQLKP